MRFPRHEMMVLSGAMVLALSVAGPAWARYNQVRSVRRARVGLFALIGAVRAYNAEYSAWPTLRSSSFTDTRFGLAVRNREVMNVLRAVAGAGNRRNNLNRNSIVFLDPPPCRPGHFGLDASGEFVDPWGMPYQLVLDTNLSGLCDAEESVYGRGLGAGVIAWSCGPDRRSDTPDDLLSWLAPGERWHAAVLRFDRLTGGFPAGGGEEEEEE
jgi:hypothetical protein